MQAKTVFLYISLLAVTYGQSQNVAINNDGSTPDSTAILDIKSNSKGILVPRMNFTERFFLIHPAAGLLVYQTDDYPPDNPPGFYYNAGTPLQPAWKRLQAGQVKLQQTLETNGSFVVPAGITKIYFEAVSGGGGRGGRSNINAGVYYFGGSGAGGGYGKGSINVSPGQTINVVIGNEGTNGTDGAAPTNGTAGGNTTISIGATNVLTLYGGGTGSGATASSVGTGGIAGSFTYDFSYVNIERFIYGANGNDGLVANNSSVNSNSAPGFTPVAGDYNYIISQAVYMEGNTLSMFTCPYFGKGASGSNANHGYVIISY